MSESVRNIQRHDNTRIKGHFLSFPYNAETVLLHRDAFADVNVSQENTGMYCTHMEARGVAAIKRQMTNKAVLMVGELSYLGGRGSDTRIPAWYEQHDPEPVIHSG